MSFVSAKPARSVAIAVKDAVSAIAAVFANLAAAAAAANAVENHRQPDAADLRRLGLEGVTFRLNA